MPDCSAGAQVREQAATESVDLLNGLFVEVREHSGDGADSVAAATFDQPPTSRCGPHTNGPAVAGHCLALGETVALE